MSDQPEVDWRLVDLLKSGVRFGLEEADPESAAPSEWVACLRRYGNRPLATRWDEASRLWVGRLTRLAQLVKEESVLPGKPFELQRARADLREASLAFGYVHSEAIAFLKQFIEKGGE